jgi:L-lysine 2,3-aminomutase
MLVLPQKQEVLPNLVLRERRRVALEMLRQLADVAHVLLFGGRPIIFKLDELLELCNRGIG